MIVCTKTKEAYGGNICNNVSVADLKVVLRSEILNRTFALLEYLDVED